jgi:hypothetical protein
MLTNFIKRQKEWSAKTFGCGVRTKGITAHIRKELVEIEAAPHDLFEWIDVVTLALDGAWRAGHSPEEIVAALQAKQFINFTRTYLMPESDDVPSEHIRVAAVLRCPRCDYDYVETDEYGFSSCGHCNYEFETGYEKV